jgi:hypothetical protein
MQNHRAASRASSPCHVTSLLMSTRTPATSSQRRPARSSSGRGMGRGPGSRGSSSSSSSRASGRSSERRRAAARGRRGGRRVRAAGMRAASEGRGRRRRSRQMQTWRRWARVRRGILGVPQGLRGVKASQRGRRCCNATRGRCPDPFSAPTAAANAAAITPRLQIDWPLPRDRACAELAHNSRGPTVPGRFGAFMATPSTLPWNQLELSLVSHFAFCPLAPSASH